MKINKIKVVKEGANNHSKIVNTKETKRYLEENLSQLEHKSIIELSRLDTGRIGNVIKGLNDHVFLISLLEDRFDSILFGASYINGQNELTGFNIEINTSDNNWMLYLVSYSMFLSKRFRILDPIDTYNTFLNQVRTLLENLDFFTITDKELCEPEIENSELIVSNPRGIVILKFEDKLEAYKSLFRHNSSTHNDKNTKLNKVYLMYSESSNLIKIGRSINPNVRERTLQGQDPKMGIITYWIAPKSVERELQELLIKKRRRGEWFDLNFGDLVMIRKYMEKYE